MKNEYKDVLIANTELLKLHDDNEKEPSHNTDDSFNNVTICKIIGMSNTQTHKLIEIS